VGGAAGKQPRRGVPSRDAAPAVRPGPYRDNPGGAHPPPSCLHQRCGTSLTALTAPSSCGASAPVAPCPDSSA
jgi:hypothetical protein